MRGVFPGDQLGRPASFKELKAFSVCSFGRVSRPGHPGDAEQGRKMTDTLWKCEQWRAGKVHNKVLFNTQAEAESFAAKMRGLEPDLPWMVEPVQASQVWN